MEKHEAITLYLISKGVPVLSQTKWNKLMFFIDGLAAVWSEKNSEITNFKYVKLPFGPVPDGYSEILNSMENAGYIVIKQKNTMYDTSKILAMGRKAPDDILSDLAPNEIKVLNAVLDVFREWNATRLSNFSHELKAWKRPDMYGQIDLRDLSDDPYLKKNFGEGNFANLLLAGRS